MRCKLVFAERKLKVSLEDLKDSKTEDKRLHSWITKAFEDISQDAFCGIQIPKKQIPKKYISQYGIDNLWKYDLPKAWRLMYSVARDEVIVIAIILEWLPHKEYERRFGY